MTGPQISEQLTRDTLEQHRQVLFYLERLERSVDRLDPQSGDREQLDLTAAEIEIFKERIKEHNDMEADHLHQCIVDALPESEDTVLGLSCQHEKMHDFLEMAILHARGCNLSDIADLRYDLREFVEMIRVHEQAEEALLAQVFESI